MKQRIAHHRLIILISSVTSAIILSFSQTSPTLAQPAAATGPALTVDAAADNYAISPDIYGMNFAYQSSRSGLALPVNRWGGNAVTRYNYQNDISNHAMDWYFENIREGNGADPQEDSAANQFITQNNSAGTKTLLTVPTIGWVAKNDDTVCSYTKSHFNPQDDFAFDRPQCGNGKRDDVWLSGAVPTDTSIAETPSFAQGWVNYLDGKYGGSAPKYYELDNEPDLWYDTHHDVHPDGAGYDELFTRGRDYALAIKAADSSAKVFGPVSWGWTGYFWSSEDIANDTPYWQNDNQSPDRWGHSNTPFLDWYLQQMHQYEIDNGVRLLDYLDIHFYTQASGVSLDSSAPLSRRLNSTRSLWDPTYKEQSDGSWIDQPVDLIPRMHDWVDNNYPGTKLALTEYNWGALNKIDGALAQADALGIFGREHLDLATLWDPPSAGQPGEYAFRMYLNYDGHGGRFGDTNVRASSANQGKLAIYGSKDSGSGALKLMAINKTTGVLTSPIAISNFTSNGCVTTYTYSPANLHAITSGWQKFSGSSLSHDFPAESITLLIVQPSSAPCSIPVSKLAAPQLTTPKNSAASYRNPTRLGWRKVKGAQSYNVVVLDSLSNVVYSANTKKTSVSPALGYGRYTWKVQAAAPDGLTAFSANWTFDVTRLSSPKRGASVKAALLNFRWKAVKGATYHLSVWQDRGLASEHLWIDQDWAKTSLKPSKQLPLTLPPGHYSWTVTVNGKVMPEWTFTVTP